MLELGAGPVGLDVQQHPDAALAGRRRRPAPGRRGGARRRGRRRAPPWPGRRAEVGGGGEDDADDVVGAEAVALEQGRQQRLHPLVHLLAGVLVEGGGAPQGSHGHRASVVSQLRAMRSAGTRAPLRRGLVERPHLLGGERAATRPASGGGRESGPIRTRTSRCTGCPTASHIRRTWRLRPSWMVIRSTPGSGWLTLAGAVTPSSSSTPSRSRRSARRRSGPPRHVGEVLLLDAEARVGQRWARSPSLVRSSRPSVSASRRPTGNTRGSAGTRSTTVGPAVGVVGRRHDAARLVEQVVHEPGAGRRPGGRRPRCGRARRRPAARARRPRRSP